MIQNNNTEEYKINQFKKETLERHSSVNYLPKRNAWWSLPAGLKFPQFRLLSLLIRECLLDAWAGTSRTRSRVSCRSVSRNNLRSAGLIDDNLKLEGSTLLLEIGLASFTLRLITLLTAGSFLSPVTTWIRGDRGRPILHI